MNPHASRRDASQLPRSIQIPILIRNSRLFQEFFQLFPKRFQSMMFLLIRNVLLHASPRRRADGEGAVSFLPDESSVFDLFVYPDRRCLLQLPHEVGEAMGRLQSDEKMNMVLHPANTLAKASETVHGSTEIFMQPVAPGGLDDGSPVLGGKDEMVVQGEEGRGHNGSWLASLRDAWILHILSGGIASLNHMPSASGGVAPLNHRLMAGNPPGSGKSWRVMLGGIALLIHMEPGGFKAISRWLSRVATIPPVSVGPSIRSRRDRSAPHSLVPFLLLLLPAISQAAPPQAALDESHRTFLRAHCTACHNADKQKGKVRLDDIAFTLVTARTALVVLAFQKSQFQ